MRFLLQEYVMRLPMFFCCACVTGALWETLRQLGYKSNMACDQRPGACFFLWHDLVDEDFPHIIMEDVPTLAV